MPQEKALPQKAIDAAKQGPEGIDPEFWGIRQASKEKAEQFLLREPHRLLPPGTDTEQFVDRAPTRPSFSPQVDREQFIQRNMEGAQGGQSLLGGDVSYEEWYETLPPGQKGIVDNAFDIALMVGTSALTGGGAAPAWAANLLANISRTKTGSKALLAGDWISKTGEAAGKKIVPWAWREATESILSKIPGQAKWGPMLGEAIEEIDFSIKADKYHKMADSFHDALPDAVKRRFNFAPSDDLLEFDVHDLAPVVSRITTVAEKLATNSIREFSNPELIARAVAALLPGYVGAARMLGRSLEGKYSGLGSMEGGTLVSTPGSSYYTGGAGAAQSGQEKTYGITTRRLQEDADRASARFRAGNQARRDQREGLPPSNLERIGQMIEEAIEKRRKRQDTPWRDRY